MFPFTASLIRPRKINSAALMPSGVGSLSNLASNGLNSGASFGLPWGFPLSPFFQAGRRLWALGIKRAFWGVCNVQGVGFEAGPSVFLRCFGVQFRPFGV